MSIHSLDAQEIRHLISRIKDLPPLLQSLQRLLEIIDDEAGSDAELENIIGYDQALTAKILRIANSTYYGFRGNVRDLPTALIILGTKQAKYICLCTLLMSMLSNGASIDLTQREILWKHAFSTSRIAAKISQRRPWVSRAEATVLGLIHDIGYLIMAGYFSEQFTSIMDMASEIDNPPWQVETEFGLTHTQLGKYLALRWAFPESLQAVIEFHHSPAMCHSFEAETRLIYLANVLGHSKEYPELLNDKDTLTYCEDLRISEEEWLDYQEDLDSIWSEVDSLWDLLK